jgi:hypothetical protein
LHVPSITVGFFKAANFDKAFDSVGYDGDLSEIKRIVSENFCGVVSSQASEDSFNVCKNSRLVKGKRKSRRPEKCYAVILDRGVAHKIHRYDKVEPSAAIGMSSVHLTEEAFKGNPKEVSLPVEKLATTQRTPPWYSCGPADIGRVYADLQLYRDTKDSGNPASVQNAWLGRLCSSKHRLALWYKGDCMLALQNFNDSSVLVWPADVYNFHGSDTKYIVPRHASTITLISMLQIEGWGASTYEWRSPSWQNETIPGSRGMSIQVRAVQTCVPTVIETVAARNAFWQLDRNFLDSFAALMGIAVPNGSNLVTALLTMIRHILKCTDEEALKAIQLRIALNEKELTFHDEIIEMDDVQDVLDRNDIQTFEQRKQHVKTSRSAAKVLEADFVEAHRALREAAAPKKKQRKTNVKTEVGGKMPPVHELSQANVKKYIPPGSFIWQGRSSASGGGWQCHFPPFRRVARSFNKYGQAESLRLCLVEL